jgi:flagellar export protein FliJ
VKKFSFSLDRVLAWRRSERELVQAGLGKLIAEREALARRADSIRGERAAYERSLANALHFDGGSVPTLPNWHTRVDRSLTELAAQLDQTRVRMEQQMERLREAELKVKLLEKLRDRRLDDWKTALNLEEENQAAEAYLARFARLKRAPDAGA